MLTATGACFLITPNRSFMSRPPPGPIFQLAALGVRATPFITPIQHGKFLVDLKGINAMRLERAGLAPEHIAVSGDCTACQPDEYWSHRVTTGVRGGQAAVLPLL